MTVVHCDWGDPDTRVLVNMWKGLGANVIHLNSNATRGELNRLNHIKDEQDTLLLTGHGGPDGLWLPGVCDTFYDDYAFSKYDVPYLKCENLIGIWCNASSFSRRYDVPGFFSDMFISNTREASYCGIHGVSQEEITRCEVEFCDIINQMLMEGLPLKYWVECIKDSLLNENSNGVEKFNYNGLYFKER